MANRNEALASDAKGAMRGAHEHAHSLGEQSGRVVDEVRELGNMALSSAGEALESVKQRGSDLLHEGRDRAEAAKDGFERYVGENPFKSVLLAAGVGALIGYALRSRR